MKTPREVLEQLNRAKLQNHSLIEDSNKYETDFSIVDPEKHLEGLTDKERCRILAYASTYLVKAVNLSNNDPYASIMAMSVVSLESLPDHLRQKAKDYLQDFIALTFLKQGQEMLK